MSSTLQGMSGPYEIPHSYPSGWESLTHLIVFIWGVYLYTLEEEVKASGAITKFYSQGCNMNEGITV